MIEQINFSDKKLLKFQDWMKTKYWVIVGFNGMPYEVKLPFLQKWFRENKNIDIDVSAEHMIYEDPLCELDSRTGSYYASISNYSDGGLYKNKSHELVLEQALVSQIKLL